MQTIAADISDKQTLVKELEKIRVNVTGIIHSAGVLKDSKIERQTKDSFNQVFKPKADGVLVLEEIEKHFNYKVNFIPHGVSVLFSIFPDREFHHDVIIHCSLWK